METMKQDGIMKILKVNIIVSLLIYLRSSCVRKALVKCKPKNQSGNKASCTIFLNVGFICQLQVIKKCIHFTLLK